jgi:hypothetical protein
MYSPQLPVALPVKAHVVVQELLGSNRHYLMPTLNLRGFIHYVVDGLNFTILSETPCADPHAGCCGGWRLETSGYPIISFMLQLIE